MALAPIATTLWLALREVARLGLAGLAIGLPFGADSNPHAFDTAVWGESAGHTGVRGSYTSNTNCFQKNHE